MTHVLAIIGLTLNTAAGLGLLKFTGNPFAGSTLSWVTGSRSPLWPWASSRSSSIWRAAD